MVKDYQERRKDFKHASIALADAHQGTLLVTATATYIPIDQFKSIFNEIAHWVEKYSIQKLIFDKRQLTVFHQPSMEWYFVDWKERMYAAGLTRHVKILPQDEVFRQSVRIGRNKINEAYPNGKFHTMEILYAETLEEAVAL
ncbi:hypothetical protein [Pseudochryseolinea flava]|uniref:Uncharacterized protein n=1 Tax=Pseudochryseolinea flava TaxID=2059302 RepID=A0A364YB27_9BACT|nr:hypothetical protein [Pseudochryseolinea flava]RAW03489.1 hypothetical protein DQQ10_00375 [Pseudochryseolinea flava]